MMAMMHPSMGMGGMMFGGPGMMGHGMMMQPGMMGGPGMMGHGMEMMGPQNNPWP